MNRNVTIQLLTVFIVILLYTYNIYTFINHEPLEYSDNLKLVCLVAATLNLTALMWFLYKRFQDYEYINNPKLTIIAQRAPTANDKQPIGAIWVDQPNDDAYVLTSIVANKASWINITRSSSLYK